MKKRFYKNLALILTLVYSVGFVPALAQQELNLGQLVIAEDLSPEERLAKKIEFTKTALQRATEKVSQMKTDLEAMTFPEDSTEESVRLSLIEKTNEYLTFYANKSESLTIITSIEEVDALIDEVIAYRETTYSPGARDILEFTLVFSYNPSVLELANTRLNNIRSDVKRLEMLSLVTGDELSGLMTDADTTLTEAISLNGQARDFILESYATSTEEISEEILEPTATSTVELDPEALPVTARSLAEQSLGKVKILYEQFLEIGEKVDQALGID